MASHYFSTTFVLARSFLKRVFRDKTALFFTFLFPLIFLLVFGALNRNGGDIDFKVALLNKSTTEFSKTFVEELKKNKVLKISESVTDFDAAREKMGRGELDSIIEIPENFGAPSDAGLPGGNMIVYFEESSPQGGQTLAAIMQGVFNGINKELTGITPPLGVEQRSTKTSDLTAFDYVFAGLLGFSILSLGIFGMANSFPAEKKTGSFRRFRVAPLRVSQLIIGQAISYLVIGLASVAVMVLAAVIIFDFSMRGNWLTFGVFTLLGIVVMFGFGLAIGGWAKNEIQAAPLTNLVAFPMMFLSGAFFPRFLMPEWLQGITGYLPLSPIVDGIRMITAEGKGLLDLGPELLLMFGWIIVIYVIAIRVFRWE